MVPDSRVSSNAATPVRHPQPLHEEDEVYLDVGAGPPKRPRLKFNGGESTMPSLPSMLVFSAYFLALLIHVN